MTCIKYKQIISQSSSSPASLKPWKLRVGRARSKSAKYRIYQTRTCVYAGITIASLFFQFHDHELLKYLYLNSRRRFKVAPFEQTVTIQHAPRAMFARYLWNPLEWRFLQISLVFVEKKTEKCNFYHATSTKTTKRTRKIRTRERNLFTRMIDRSLIFASSGM